MNGSATAPAPRRPLRDLLVDTGMFLLAAAFGIFTAVERLNATMPVPAWLFDLDQVIGALGCAALWLRRRRPVELAVVLIALSAFSEMVAGAMLAALFTVAVHRPPRISLAVFGLSLVTALLYVRLRPEPDMPGLLLFLLGVTIQGAVVGWGLFVHHRRRLVLSLRDRAARAETEAHLRALQARHLAREEIAREIHDVLGHRLSLLSVHAGALEYHPGASPEDIARAAKVIRESAHQALQDLRDVIGVLRAPVGELPQPTLADVRHLVAESRLAGMRVELREELAGPVPDAAGHTAYRIVQEGLTNARKHAPGAEVRVRVAGAPGQGLHIDLTNTAPATAPGTEPAPPGTEPAPLGTEPAPLGTEPAPFGTEPAPAPTPLPGPASTPAPASTSAPASTPAPASTSAPASTPAPASAPALASASRARPGQGLIGLAERVALAGGRLEHGPAAPQGDWRLSAWLPWPA
ncbi:sensor histidine kinase [Sphaerisporangium perillae]|uniref:sensor histidine kinase n=1 Tax=Sphaerisporangium perillae TaxID=2935860 RepID=UPI00200FFAD5|nr:histidine kinase [Sphaerisporangium perillae]